MSTPAQRVYSVELIGFSAADRTVFASTFALSQRRPVRYVQHRDQGQRPDIYLVDADDLKAMVEFSGRSPDNMHPALLVGIDAHNTGWPLIARPIRWVALFELLDRTVEQAEIARGGFADTEARNRWPFVDRRSRARLDVDLNDTGNYSSMRSEPTSTVAGVRGALATVPISDVLHDIEAESGPARVLVGDVDAQTREIIASRCAEIGAEVEFADTCERTLELLDTRRYLGVFVDRDMPGIEISDVCRLVKRRDPFSSALVVVTNAHGGAIERVRLGLTGCDAWLTRPIDAARVAELLSADAGGTAHDVA